MTVSNFDEYPSAMITTERNTHTQPRPPEDMRMGPTCPSCGDALCECYGYRLHCENDTCTLSESHTARRDSNTSTAPHWFNDQPEEEPEEESDESP